MSRLHIGFCRKHLMFRQSCDSLASAVARLRSASTLARANPPVSTKFASVLVPLFEGEAGDLRVLLCQRTQTLSTHAGEVALPGGKRDETDIDEIHTALREAEEELGIKEVEVLGRLKPMLSKHYLSVTPVLGRIGSLANLKPNPAEVEKVFDVPLSTFLTADPRIYSFQDTQKAFKGEVNYRLHFFQCGEHCVWGLTAAILIEAARQALGREPEFKAVADQREYSDIIYDQEQDRAMYREI